MKKQFRICKNYEFSSIIANRTFVKSSSFVLYFVERKEEHSRIGLSVGKKLGNAVCRNMVKRQVRMMVDQIFDFEEAYDVVIIVRPMYHQQSFAQNLEELKEDKKRLEKRFRKMRG